MTLYTCPVLAEAKPSPAGPTPGVHACQESRQLALFPTDHDVTHLGSRATPEEIDQVFRAQLVAHPRSVFLREVVADRARRRLTGTGLEDAGIDALLSTFVERVGPDQHGAGWHGGGGETLTDRVRAS